MTFLPTRRPPTHILRIDVPLSLPNQSDRQPEFEAVDAAIKIALSASHAAYTRVICDNAQVSLVPTDG